MCTEHDLRIVLTELTGQYVGAHTITVLLFGAMSYVSDALFVVSKPAWFLWLSKPTFLSNHQFIGVSYTFSTYSPLVGLTVPLLCPLFCPFTGGSWDLFPEAVVGRPE